jgi:hypothetical protein
MRLINDIMIDDVNDDSHDYMKIDMKDDIIHEDDRLEMNYA